MQTRNPKIVKTKWQIPMLSIGLLGIVNFFVGCWSCMPPSQDHYVFFWLVRFYDDMLFPSLVFFPISMIFVALSLIHFLPHLWIKIVVMIISTGITILSFIPSMVIALFGATTRIEGYAKQDNHTYYLVDYAFGDLYRNIGVCKSDYFGFYGKCSDIAWESNGVQDAIIYLDPITNLITVKSEQPLFIWTNSVPPTCIEDPDIFGMYFRICN